MNWHNALPLLILGSTLLPGLMIFCVPEQRRGLRTLLNLGGILSCIVLIAVLLEGVYSGEVFLTRVPLLPNMDLVLHADALSLLFVSLSGILWGLTTVYAIGYLEGSSNRSRFFGFFSLCVFATMGIALAGNLITFLIFYELLTLTTYPLLAHKGNPPSLRAARIYLIYTMAGGALLLAGVVWLKALAGPLEFTATGILAGLPELDPVHLQLIFVLLIAGLGVKAAIVPLHGWLPIAMAAPAPVSALLHAVAVVKAGAFGIVRVVYDVYGVEFARDLGLTILLAVLAAFTIVYGSLRAMFQDDLKKRLAYSTVSQVSYIALGTAIAGPIASIGGIVHLVHQGLMKITLFFCAGNFAETLGVHKITEMNGLGQRMPWTMAAFSLAALGMIGIPPAAGFVSKWYLGMGALEAQAYWVMVVLAISSLLNAAYFLPILYRAWIKPPVKPWPAELRRGRLETPWMLLLPPVITAVLALAVGLLANSLMSPINWAELIAAQEYGTEFIRTIQIEQVLAPELWWIVVTPLLFSGCLLVERLRQACLWLCPWAAAPALLASVMASTGDSSVAWLFFGSIMGLDDTGRVFLLLAGVLWLAAGFYAQDYLRADENKTRFFLFFLLAMSGNFGVILAQDIFGFITFFTLMSLAAYGLVVYTGKDDALLAGKTYMQWVVLGEVLLFAALTGLAFSTETSNLREMSLASQPVWVTGLLLAGFGIKIGLFPFHVWLPRAHPVAPIPASALLSGIMVKVGLLGWLRFLPLGEVELGKIGAVVIALGLAGTFLAMVAGIVQRNPKTLLAYSTISQMGIIAAAVGAGLLDPSLWILLYPALLLYAVHHGVTKAALFLSVGFASECSSRRPYRVWVWAAVAVPALALAGLPFTGGALAKAALKTATADLAWLAMLFSLSAIGTTLLMLRFLRLMANTGLEAKLAVQPSVTRWLAYLVVVFLAVIMVYLLPQAHPFLSSAFSGDALWSAFWPLLAGLTVYLAIRRTLDLIPPIPAGDLLLLLELAGRSVQALSNYLAQTANEFHRTVTDALKRQFTPSPASVASPSAKSWLVSVNPGFALLGVLLAILLAMASGG